MSAFLAVLISYAGTVKCDTLLREKRGIMRNNEKKFLVCVDLSLESFDLMKGKIKQLSWEVGSEVVFCHVFPRKVYADNFLLSSYPSKEEEVGIEEAVHQVLRELGNDVFEESSSKSIKWSTVCLIAINKKKALADYTFEKDIDEVYVGTSNRSGMSELFTSSLAEYLVGHTACDLRVFKPEATEVV